MARIGIIGSAGRMGQAIAAAIAAAGETHAGGIDVGGDPLVLARESDVLVDFSSPKALEANLDAATAASVPIVVGTTGIEERHHWLVDSAAERTAVDMRWEMRCLTSTGRNKSQWALMLSDGPRNR